MTVRLAISGFGRIGRMVLRALVETGRDDVEIVLINTPGPVETSLLISRYLRRGFLVRPLHSLPNRRHMGYNLRLVVE